MSTGSLLDVGPPPGGEPSASTLRRAADRGADYLVQNLRPNGKFVYQRDALSGRPLPGRYNLLRHFGSLWAMLDLRGGDPAVRRKAERGFDWAVERYYVRTRRGGAFRKRDRLVTGCSGLALLAIDRLSATSGVGPAEHVRAEIVEYLLANQITDTEDGLLHDFHHKLSMSGLVVDGVHDDVTEQPEILPFRSNYYTGEILFGLIVQLMPPRPWPDDGAARERLFSAISRSLRALMGRDYGVAERSHWMMYAIRHYCELTDQLAGTESGHPAVDAARAARGEMVRWASRIAASVLASTTGRSDSRSAPTACRVEAQVQFLELVDRSAGELSGRSGLPELTASVLGQVAEDCTLLLRLQDGATGGFIGSAEQPIMQIDYTQHAISALKGAVGVLERCR